jgi:hypothetical protein
MPRFRKHDIDLAHREAEASTEGSTVVFHHGLVADIKWCVEVWARNLREQGVRPRQRWVVSTGGSPEP